MAIHDWGVTLMVRAAADVEDVLERQPRLSDFGFGLSPGVRVKTWEECAAWLQGERGALREPRALGQFVAARLWLSRFDKLKAANTLGTSYGLKHVAEREIGYVTNGCFIAVAFAEGFRVQCVGDSPNALFNISTKAWSPPARWRRSSYDGGAARADGSA